MQKGPPFIFYLFYVTYKTGRDQRVPPFNFFRHCANFFSKFFKVSKESPLRVFWYFATECVLMNPKGSPFSFFGTMRHFQSFFQKNFFKKIFKFYFVPSRETVIFQSYRAWKAHFGCLQSVFKAFHEHVLSIFRKLCASWALDIAPTLDVPVLLNISIVKQIGWFINLCNLDNERFNFISACSFIFCSSVFVLVSSLRFGYIQCNLFGLFLPNSNVLKNCRNEIIFVARNIL